METRAKFAHPYQHAKHEHSPKSSFDSLKTKIQAQQAFLVKQADQQKIPPTKATKLILQDKKKKKKEKGQL